MKLDNFLILLTDKENLRLNKTRDKKYYLGFLKNITSVNKYGAKISIKFLLKLNFAFNFCQFFLSYQCEEKCQLNQTCDKKRLKISKQKTSIVIN